MCRRAKRPSGDRLISLSFAGVCNNRCGGELPSTATVNRSQPVSLENAAEQDACAHRA